MANRIAAGLIAGAVGTVALNLTNHLDMLVRGRPPSDMPTKVAAKVADEIGLPLDFELNEEDETDRPATDNRTAALGALMGIANGLAIGLLYGIVRLVVPRPPTWLAGALLGGLAMGAADYPAAKLGLTDPDRWRGTSWMADVVPHMAYGVATAVAFDAAHK